MQPDDRSAEGPALQYRRELCRVEAEPFVGREGGGKWEDADDHLHLNCPALHRTRRSLDLCAP
jgi:hypothetical protein